MGIFSDLFGDSKESVSSLPPYLEEFYKSQMMPRLTGMMDRPYPVYGQRRIEDFSPEEQDAFGRITQDATTGSSWAPQVIAGMEMTERGSSPYEAALLGPEGRYDPSQIGEGGNYDKLMVGKTDQLTPAAIERYMSPYKNTVVDSAIARINDSSDRAALRDRARATRTGNLYSAGHGIIDAERDRNTAREIGDTTGRLMDEGYKGAVSQFNLDTDRQLGARTGDVNRLLSAKGTDIAAKNRAVEFLMSQGLTREQANQQARNTASQFNRQQQMSGAQQMAKLGEMNRTLRNADYDRLGQVGSAKRAQGQKSLDMAYKDFMDQYNWPLENISKISGVASGQPYTKTQTQTESPSPFNTAAGAALIASKFFGFADGGMVPGIEGPRGPVGPAMARKKKESHTPGRQGGLPPPMMNARRTGRDSYAA